MTDSTRWGDIARQYVSTLPSGTVFRSRELFEWVQANVIIDLADLMPPNRPAWRSRLSRALRALDRQGVIIQANEMPRCQVWVVP